MTSTWKPIIREGLGRAGDRAGAGPVGKSVLLKPNLVEPSKSAPHINTHPALVRAVAEVFRSWDAREVFVAEGQGHCRDTGFVCPGAIGPRARARRGEAGIRRPQS